VVEDISAVAGKRAPGRDSKRRDEETGELLSMLGLEDRLNKPIAPAGGKESA